MKKILSPILMILLALVGFMPAQAQVQLYWTQGSEAIIQPQADTYYVIDGVGVNPSTVDLLCGNTTVGSASYEAIYQFEPAGTDTDGNPLWRLYWVSEDSYLADPDKNGGRVAYTKSKSQAYVFTALVAVPSELGYKDAYAADPSTDIRTYHYNGQNHVCDAECVIFANKNYAKSEFKWFEWYHGYGVMWDQYTTANIWKIYTAEPYPAYDQLCMYVADNSNAASRFSVGNKPGQVSAELVDALNAAIKEAQDLANNPDEKPEVYEAAIQKILDAIAACEAGVIQVPAGYYIFTNNPTLSGQDLRGNGHAVIYDKGTEMHWYEYDLSTGVTAEHMKAIWEVIPVEGEKGFYLKNMKTNRYAGGQGAKNSVVPTTEAPEQIYYINLIAGTELYSLDQKEQNSSYPALHAQGDGTRIVIWESAAGASNWSMTEVSAETVASLQEGVKQIEMNEAYAALLNQAKETYAKGFTYSADRVTHDGVFTVGDGLVTDGSKLVSNAFETQEGPNCSYGGLLDNNFDTYFHSVWSSGAYADSYHHLDAELSEAIDVLVLKYAKRPNDGGGNPSKIHVYASNDTTNGNWTDQGYMYCSYPWSITLANGDEKAGQAGSSFAVLDNKYKYIRLAVEETTGMSRTNGNLFWYWSELRIYSGYYDTNKSIIEAVPADVRKAMEDAIKNGETLVQGNVKQEDIDALQATYDKFLANFPDPQIVKDLLDNALAQAEAAVEGDAYGYFEEGSVDALKAALETVSGQVKEVMTVAEVNAAQSTIETAMKAFNDALIKPADGSYIFIKSLSQVEETNPIYSPAGKYLYAKNNGEESKGVFCWGTLDEENTDKQLSFMWKFIKTEDGYALQNAATGSYVHATPDPLYYTGLCYDQESLQIQSAKAEGAFNIATGNNVFLMAYPDGQSVVTWEGASGYDRCAFEFIDCEWEATYVHQIAGQYPQIVTLPFEICSYLKEEVTLYSVLGHKDNNLQLKAYDTEAVIEAGTPFILIPQEGATSAQFYTTVETFDELTYDYTGKTQNGMVGTIKSTKLGAGLAFLYEGEIFNTIDNEPIAANTGYFTEKPETTETGDAAILFDVEISIPDGIEQMMVVKNPATTGVYTMTGVKVRNNANVQGLPKGLYIIAGKKVYVK